MSALHWLAVLLWLSSAAHAGDSGNRGAEQSYRDDTALGGSGDNASQLARDDEKKEVVLESALFDPWFEAKHKVNEAIGLKFSVAWTGLVMAATRSGGETSAAGGILDIKLNWTLVGRKSPNKGVLGFRIEDRHGLGTVITPNELGAEMGTLWKPDVLFANFRFAPTELWYEQRAMSGRFAIRIGKLISPALLYDGFLLRVPQFAMINESLIFPATPYPGNGLGAVASVFPTKHVYFIAGIHDANAVTKSMDMSSFFADREYFVGFEVGWAKSFDQRKTDNYHLSLWYRDERTAAGSPQGVGGSVSFQRYVGERYLPWARYSYAYGGAVPVEHLFSVGLGYRLRTHDFLALGVSVGVPWANGLRTQTGVELVYRVYLARTLSLIPGFQLYIHPSNNPALDVAGVFTTRMRVAF